MLLKKLKIIKSVDIYSTSNTWNTYREVVSPIKENLISGNIKVLDIVYKDDFDKEYNPYTKEKSWGSNLDEFILNIDFNLNCTLTHYKINSFSKFNYREFMFKINFKLPKKLLLHFESEIERKFYNKCLSIREEEKQLEEEKRIKEIGEKLLTSK